MFAGTPYEFRPYTAKLGGHFQRNASLVWTVVAGGDGFGLIVTEGPPLTHGWYALFSGLAWCPAAAWLLGRYARIETSYLGWLAVALVIILAGRSPWW